MIERKILHTKLRDYQVNELLAESLSKVGFSSSKVKKTPLGEKISIVASRPGLVVGRKGSNIKNLTKILKNRFKLENPQIEIEEVKNQNLDAQIVAEKIQSALERFGTKKFKGVGHKMITDVMSAGAMGVEILISGKIPSQRAKTWRFYKGYLKKCGDIATSQVAVAYAAANLKSGTVGIQVRIMLPGTWLPDRIDVLDNLTPVSTIEDDKSEEEVPVEVAEEPGESDEVSDSEESTSGDVKSTKEKSAKKKDSKINAEPDETVGDETTAENSESSEEKTE